jgi:hypothetical protein
MTETSGQVEGFFYGLYMDPELLLSLGFRPAASRMARLESHELELKGSVKIVRKQGSTVWGILIKLPEKDLKAMYDFETTKAYRPEIVNVITNDGENIAVSCYNLPVDETAELNIGYLEKLIPVARRLNLPIEYIKKLERIHHD